MFHDAELIFLPHYVNHMLNVGGAVEWYNKQLQFEDHLYVLSHFKLKYSLLNYNVSLFTFMFSPRKNYSNPIIYSSRNLNILPRVTGHFHFYAFCYISR